MIHIATKKTILPQSLIDDAIQIRSPIHEMSDEDDYLTVP